MGHDGTPEEKDALTQEGIRVGVLGPKGNVNGIDPDTLARRVAFYNPFFDSPYIDAIPGIEKTRARAEAREQDNPPPSDDADPSDGGDDAPVERKKPHVKRHGKPPKATNPPHKGGRWVKIFDHDADLIINSRDPASVNALALWYVLSREVFNRSSYTFEASDGYLAKTKVPKGMASDKTVQRAAKLLHSLGLLESESEFDPSTNQHTPLRRTLKPSGHIFDTPKEPISFS